MFMPSRRGLLLPGRASRAAAAVDADYANVSLLLHMDGSNGSQTFTDQKGNHTITADGNGQITTTGPKFGTGAFISDGTGDYMHTGTLSSSGTLDLSGSQFTIEMWVYMASSGVNRVLCSWGNTYPADYGGEMYLDTSAKIRFGKNASTGIITSGSIAVTSNQWVHVAVTRDGSNNYRSFVDGVLDQTVNDTNGPDFKTSGMWLCGNSVYGAWPNGSKCDDIRITKGVCRYSATFTPPTAAFPDSA